VVKELFRRFSRDQCPAFAAALSYFGILAIMPMLVVALAAVAFVLRSPHEARLRLQELVISLLPGSAAQETVRQVLTQTGVEKSVTTLIQTRGLAGLIGLLSLLWVSLQIFVNAAPAMNAAFAVAGSA
jgi:membrane protein